MLQEYTPEGLTAGTYPKMEVLEHDFPFQQGDFQVNHVSFQEFSVFPLRISRDPPMEEFEHAIAGVFLGLVDK